MDIINCAYLDADSFDILFENPQWKLLMDKDYNLFFIKNNYNQCKKYLVNQIYSKKDSSSALSGLFRYILAISPKLPAALLENLGSTNDINIINNILTHKTVNRDLFYYIAKYNSSNESVLKRIARHSRTNSSTLEYIRSIGNAVILEIIAKNLNTNRDTLQKIVNMTDIHYKYASELARQQLLYLDKFGYQIK